MTEKIKVQKRNNEFVEYDGSKIVMAIAKSMEDSVGEVDYVIANEIEDVISGMVYSEDETVWTVDDVSDEVESQLMEFGLHKTAKAYILYRAERNKDRQNRIDEKIESKFFSNEFLSKYKHAKEPFNPLGSFVYYRTYSSWLPELGRRETWFESVKRMVEFNCGLAPTSKEEAEKLFHNVFYLKQNLSGRMAFIGGKPTSYEHPLSLFNCAFIACDDMKVFNELFYMLMLGSGVGFKVTKEEVTKLPKVKQGVELISKHRKPKKPSERNEYTTTEHLSKNIIEIIIGDSREGFKDALDIYFKVLYDVSYRDINTVLINYDNIREEGERLKRFGGKSGGFEPLVKMFDKIHETTQKLEDGKYKLKPIDCLDIANIIGENVVAGNIRRTAEILIFSPDDEEIMNAKNDLYTQENGQWNINQKIIHRAMSNNTVVFEDKPTKEVLHEIFERMKVSAEPAFYNIKEARRRNPNAQGLNPLNKSGGCKMG